ncbi:hypothetical protein PAMP_020467 [Pampus punctatissimus]
MNPLEWEDGPRRLPRNLDTNHQSGVNNSTGSTSTTRDTYCEYSSPPSRNFSEVEDEEDAELTRKRKQLREIEERIMCKKVAIALKTVEPIVKKASPSYSCNDQSATCKDASLRDRVNAILQQRHSLIFLTKSAQEGKNSSSLSEGGVLLEDHPLKRRVKALMKQRCSDPCVLPTKVPDVTPLSPRQSMTSPAQEESSVNKGFQRFLSVLNKGVDIDLLRKDLDVTLLPSSQSVTSAEGEQRQKESSVNKGFQRFLSVLNKGVDIDLLSRIVNDDSEDLPLSEELLNIQSPVVESKAHLPFRSESQQFDNRALLPDRSRTCSGERKTDPPSQELSHNESHSLPDEEEEEKKNDRGHHCFGSSSGSMSPPAVNKKKTEVKSKADEQREQLQNILNTLGFSLEVEEMSQLADRTQQRLYGKKHEGGQSADNRQEQKSQPEGSHRHHSKSSSFSSSRLTSRSLSPSPSRYLSSHRSGSQERGRASERSLSRHRNKDEVTRQDGIEAERHVDNDGKHSEEAFSFQHPQNLTYPSPHPPDFSTFPDYSLAQYSEHTAYHDGSDSGAKDSYSTYTQDVIPSHLHPSRCPYPQSTYHHFPGPVMAPNMVFPYYHSFEDINFPVNPDLSKSEGQIGSSSRPRCLQVISTKQSSDQSCLKHLKKDHNRKGKYRTHHHSSEDINFPVNPDLSKSEGQIGSSSRPRCLQVISTKQSNDQSCLKHLKKDHNRKGKYRTHHHSFEDINIHVNPDLPMSEGQIGSCSGLQAITKESKSQLRRREKDGKSFVSMKKCQKKARYREKKRLQRLAAKQSEDSVESVDTQTKKEEAEQSEEETQQKTEEEIKANLKRKSFEHYVTYQSPAVPEEKKSTTDGLLHSSITGSSAQRGAALCPM